MAAAMRRPAARTGPGDGGPSGDRERGLADHDPGRSQCAPARRGAHRAPACRWPFVETRGVRRRYAVHLRQGFRRRGKCVRLRRRVGRADRATVAPNARVPQLAAAQDLSEPARSQSAVHRRHRRRTPDLRPQRVSRRARASRLSLAPAYSLLAPVWYSKTRPPTVTRMSTPAMTMSHTWKNAIATPASATEPAIAIGQ